MGVFEKLQSGGKSTGSSSGGVFNRLKEPKAQTMQLPPSSATSINELEQEKIQAIQQDPSLAPASSMPTYEPPAEKELPWLAQVQKDIYDHTLGPVQKGAMRIAGNIVDPFHLARGIAEREGMQTQLEQNPIIGELSAPDTTAEKVTDVAGQIAGSLAPGGLSYKLVGKPLGKLAVKGIERFPALQKFAASQGVDAATAAGTLTRGAGAGLGFGAMREGLEAATGDQQSLGGRAQDIGLDAALGGVGDIGLNALGPLVKKGFARLKDLKAGRQAEVMQPNADVLALPPANRYENVRARGDGTVLPTNEAPIYGQGDIHTFGLPEGRNGAELSRLRSEEQLGLPSNRRYDEAMQRSRQQPGTDPIIASGDIQRLGLPEPSPQMRNFADGEAAVREVNNELSRLDSQREIAIRDQFNYLKKSRDDRGGIQQGQLHRDQYGDVHGRTGRISNNPKWYQDFYSENGKVPSNKDLWELAKKHVDEGYDEGVFQVPSWSKENGYHETRQTLMEVRKHLSDSLNEMYPGTGEAAITQQLRFKPKAPKAQAGENPQLNLEEIAQRLQNVNRMKRMQDIRRPEVISQASPLRDTVGFRSQLPKTNQATTEILPPRQKFASVQSTSSLERKGFARLTDTDMTSQNPRRTFETVPNERGLVTTLRESGKLTDDVQRGIEASPSRDYQPITNQGTDDAAIQRIGRGVDEAESFALGGKGAANAEQIATGFRLIDQFQKSGQTQRAINMAERLAERLTEAGQTVQAASIWNRLTPEGALLAATRKVKEINRNLPKLAKEVQLTEKNANDIQTAASAIQAAGGSKTRATEVMDILDRLKAKQNVTDAERQAVVDFVKDAETFVKPKQPRIPKQATAPKEMAEPRVRDRVVSFLEQQEKAAKERLRARGIQVSSLPIDVYADYALIGALKLAKGSIKFADWSEQMVRDLGENIRPVLADIYEKAQETIASQVKRVTTEKVEQATQAAKRIGSTRKPNEQLQELSELVRDAIDKSKNKTITETELARIRELSKEIIENAPESVPMTEQDKTLQSVRALAKKLAGEESVISSPSQNLREVQTLVRQITGMADDSLGPQKLATLDKSPLEDLSAKLLERPTPSQAEKVATSYLRKNQDNLDSADIQLVRNLAKEVSGLAGDAQAQASQDLQAILNGFERAGIGRKLSAGQYIFMLLNPLTQVKNIAGNELLYRLERMNRTIATPFDWATSKLTGKDRQITFRGGPVTWDNFFAPTKDYTKGLFQGTKAGWRGVNPEGLTTAYDINGQAFRSKLNPLTYLEKTLGAVMKGFDYAAYNRATQQRLREMAHLDAMNKGIKGRLNVLNHIDRYMGNLDDNIATVAKEYGKYVTLQDNTLLSNALQSLKGGKYGLNRLSTFGLSQNFGAGNLIIPFAKTPANLLMRAIDYSPAGFAKTIMQVGDILLKKETDLTRADVIQSVTRALLGTGIGGVGLWLADKGVLRGESASDIDVRELEKQAGVSQYQLNASAVQRMLGALIDGNLSDVDRAAKIQPGDILYQYEWAQPSSIPLALGANIYQERKQAARDLTRLGETEGLAKQSVDVTTGALNTLFNTSVLQGLQRAFDFAPGEENKVRAFGENLIKQVPSMAVPSIVSRINMLRDDAVRETYSPDFTENLLNPAQSRVPGKAQQLPQRVDTLGQPQKRENSVFDVMLNPAQKTVYKPSDEAKFVIDLLAETGDERVAPRAVAKYITGTDPRTRQSKKVDLTGAQLVKLQTIVGQETAKRLGRLNPNLSTERKVKAVIDILDEAGKIGRDKMKKELGLR